jgi:hypothetical protein
MSSNNQRGITPGKGGGFITDLTQRIKLIVRLMGDSRVSIFLKILPVASLGYIIFPDIPGPIDDATVVWLGTYLFVELCPPAVVQEHLNDIRSGGKINWKDLDEDTLDAEVREPDNAGAEENQNLPKPK